MNIITSFSILLSLNTAGRKFKRHAGFTLIEVLIASVLLSIGMTVLLVAASKCIGVMRVSKEYQDSQWVLRLGELENPIFRNEEYDNWEVRGKSYGNFKYIREVTETEDLEDGLFILTSRATWASRGREVYDEVTRFVFLPEEAEFLP